MDPSELWPSLYIIKDLNAFAVNFEEPPYFRSTIVLLIILWDARESERAAWDPRTINTTKVQETNNNSFVTRASSRNSHELSWQHQMTNTVNWAEDGTDV